MYGRDPNIVCLPNAVEVSLEVLNLIACSACGALAEEGDRCLGCHGAALLALLLAPPRHDGWSLSTANRLHQVVESLELESVALQNLRIPGVGQRRVIIVEDDAVAPAQPFVGGVALGVEA